MHDIKFDGKCHINAKLCAGPEQPVQPATVWLKIWKYPLENVCGGKLANLRATSVDGVKKEASTLIGETVTCRNGFLITAADSALMKLRGVKVLNPHRST